VQRLAVVTLLAMLVLTGCAADGVDGPAASVTAGTDRELATDETPSAEPDDQGAAPEPDADGAAPEPDDDGAPADPGPTSPEADATDPSDPEQPVEALAFTARSLTGGSVDLASFSGDAVALWMWAPW
jgi:hypothetical protein